MNSRGFRITSAVLILAALSVSGWALLSKGKEGQDGHGRKAGASAAPVEVGEIQIGPIEQKRIFSGALEASEKFIAAPKIGGKITRLHVDISDPVDRGQVVAELDSEEYVQARASAEAEVAVAQAKLAEALSALQNASREARRVETLYKKKISHESQLDAALSLELVKNAQLKVAEAQLSRARAILETANIKLGYASIKADWEGADETRVVSARYVDQGDTVSANTPLVRIERIDPVKGVIHVTEKDYVHLSPGQAAYLTTDAYSGRTFKGVIERIAPAFDQATRQARVELSIENKEGALKPGMYIQCSITLARVENAVLVPTRAVTVRNDRTGVFLVNEDGKSVSWREVREGLKTAGATQVFGEGISGKVVTLGTHLLADGSAIAVPQEAPPAEKSAP